MKLPRARQRIKEFLALVCFDSVGNRNCETFNGTVVEKLPFEAKEGHWNGALSLHHGRPTAIGGQNYPRSNRGYTEKIGENGWEKLTSHPR